MCPYKYIVYAGPGSCMCATSQWVLCFQKHDTSYEYKLFNHNIYSKRWKDVCCKKRNWIFITDWQRNEYQHHVIQGQLLMPFINAGPSRRLHFAWISMTVYPFRVIRLYIPKSSPHSIVPTPPVTNQTVINTHRLSSVSCGSERVCTDSIEDT